MATKTKIEKTVKDNKASKKEYVFAVGRRKAAVARVRLYSTISTDLNLKKGQIIVNQVPIEQYFNGDVAKEQYLEPFKITNTLNKFAVSVKVEGGGKDGQLTAMILGIARALSALDKETYRPVLKRKELLTRDPRVRQRRKVGMGGKSRRKKQSPKR